MPDGTGLNEMDDLDKTREELIEENRELRDVLRDVWAHMPVRAVKMTAKIEQALGIESRPRTTKRVKRRRQRARHVSSAASARSR